MEKWVNRDGFLPYAQRSEMVCQKLGKLLSIDSLEELDVVAVKAAPEAVRNTILDTCRESQCDVDTARHVFRALPEL